MKAISLFTGAGGMDISASNAGIETVFANDTEPEAAETQRMAMPETDFVVGDVKGVLWVPSIAVAVRRLHDTGRSGWWLLLAFRAAPGLILIIFFVLDSESSDNQWGPPPLGSRSFRGQVQG